MEITILDVGHGNCSILRHGNRSLVIDAGPGTALLEFVLENEIEFVEEILISHADADHIKGVDALLDHDGIGIKSVRLNSDAAKESEQWDAMLFSLDDRRSTGEINLDVQLVAGMTLGFFDADIEVLAPSAYLAAKGPGSQDYEGRRISTNTISAVVRVKTPDQSVLFTGDIDEVGLRHLLASKQDLRADILVFPHHGGNIGAGADAGKNRAFADRLLRVVDPEIVVFSFSRLRSKYPRPEFVDAVISSSTRKVMCTQMSKRCLDHSPNEESHLANAFADGRRFGNCCAGTIVVADSETRPSVKAHTGFVRSYAPNALCTGNHSVCPNRSN